jgi:hypothetical protein
MNYYEDYDERVSCKHPIYCTRTHRDSKGHTYTTTYVCGHHHLYDVDYTPPQYEIVLNDRTKKSISAGRYTELVNKLVILHFMN